MSRWGYIERSGGSKWNREKEREAWGGETEGAKEEGREERNEKKKRREWVRRKDVDHFRLLTVLLPGRIMASNNGLDTVESSFCEAIRYVCTAWLPVILLCMNWSSQLAFNIEVVSCIIRYFHSVNTCRFVTDIIIRSDLKQLLRNSVYWFLDTIYQTCRESEIWLCEVTRLTC